MTRNGKYSRGSLMMSWIKLLIIVWDVYGLTTQAQRPGPRGRPIATATRWPGSLQRMVRPLSVDAHFISGYFFGNQVR